MLEVCPLANSPRNALKFFEPADDLAAATVVGHAPCHHLKATADHQQSIPHVARQFIVPAVSHLAPVARAAMLTADSVRVNGGAA